MFADVVLAALLLLLFGFAWSCSFAAKSYGFRVLALPSLFPLLWRPWVAEKIVLHLHFAICKMEPQLLLVLPLHF